MSLPQAWFDGRNPMAAAMERAVRSVKGEGVGIDPLERLMDPSFSETLWYYEHSHTEPDIPGQLHPKQVDALHAPSRSRFLFWGNQVGKSTLGAVDACLFALGRHPVWSNPALCAQQGLNGHEPPVLVWASALTWDLWENILLPELLTWIPPERIIDAPTPRRSTPKRTILVRADNGTVSRIVGKSAEQGRKKYQSSRVHHVWYDEEHPKDIRDEVQPRLLRHGGHEITTATPLLGLTWMYNDIYVPWKQGKRPDVFISHAGLKDNPAIDPAEIERIEIEYEGDPAQRDARLYGLFTQPSGLAVTVDPQKHFETYDLRLMQEKAQKEKWKHVCGIDFGYWRFSFVHGVIDRAERCHIAGELFSQKQTLEARARWIHDYLTDWGADRNARIWGDSANPQDILEINKELKKLDSPFRVRGVSKGSAESVGFIRASLGRVNNLLARGALLFRRGMSDSAIWYRGQSAASEGTRMIGSRLLWELANYRYPAPKGDEAQKQNPDEDTADGADATAALRYLIASHYTAPDLPARKVENNPNIDTKTDEILARVAKAHRAARGL